MSGPVVEIDFPCEYVFKAFFAAEVAAKAHESALAAVNRVVPCSRDALRERQSAKGSYSCLSIVVRLHSRDQLESVYAELRELDGLVYLL